MTRWKPAPPWTRDDMREELSAAVGAQEVDALMMTVDRYVQDERERIAQAIEAIIPDPHKQHEDCSDYWALRQAARIARAGS